MEWIILGPLVLIVFLAWWLVQSFLLRLVVGGVAEVALSWPRAAVTVLLAGFTQSCTMGLLIGADGGCFGTVLGWAIWSAVVAFTAGLTFARALIVGAVMAVLNWLLAIGLVMAVLALGLGAALGIGAWLGAAASAPML